MSSHHTANVKKQDIIYAISTDEAGKESSNVVKVTKVLESSYIGVAVKTAHHTAQTVEIQKDAVRINLGPNPPDIKVGDCNLAENFTVHQTEHSFFGAINWSFVPEDEVEKRVHKAYTGTAKFLNANGLGDLSRLPIIHEVYHKITKYAGRYKSSRDLAKNSGFMRFCPLHEKPSLEHSSYVAAHEVGHVIDLQLLVKRPKLRAKWIELYHETLAPITVDKDTRAELLSKLKESASLSDFKALIRTDEDQLEAAKAIFAYINKAHGLRPFDIDVILLAENAESLEAYWPKSSSCFTRKLTPSVSEYATVNVHELFAESFAFYVAGVKLPKAITSLMEESLQKASRTMPLVIKDMEDAHLGGKNEE